MPANRYTAAMLAELVGVPASRVRDWQRRGWIVPVEQTHRLAYFDFAELTVARKLAELRRGGASARLITKKLVEIEKRFPDVRRPLAELNLVLDGPSLLVRRGSDLMEPHGQLRLDFDAAASTATEHEPTILASPAFFLSRKGPLPTEQAAPGQLTAWAADLDEAGNLTAAAEMYRAALAAGGADPELCFQLADVLYRAGDLAAARERYFMALELDEEYVEARVSLGCVLREQGDAELAASAFAGAIQGHEAYADAHFHLARTLDFLGRREESIAHWRRFADLAPDSPWAIEAHERLQEG
jgi:tetratricopeptide (TPR) repeat protein